MRTFLRPALAFFLVGSFALVVGCGSSEKLYPVSGKVTVGDAPLDSGIITFVPDESKGNKSKHSPTGKIESGGKYTLSTDTRSGAPAGWYKVTVRADSPGMGGATQPDPNKPNATLPGAPAGVKIDPKYQDPSKTDVHIEVVTNSAEGKYDVKIPK